jgi:putative PIN family toxin of toxin-antitoxin system
VLEYCLETDEVVVSGAIVDELINELREEKLAPNRWLNTLRRTFYDKLTVIDTPEATRIVRDPKDDHVIAAALSEDCEFIITGDKDLLTLRLDHEIKIVTPVQYADMF